jgi:hypothetical protein
MLTTGDGGIPMTNHTKDAIAVLAAANPVPDLPAVEPAERLRRLIEAEDRSAAPGAPRRRTSKASIVRAMTAAVAALAAVTAGMLLADGSSAPGVNIAAAAYAATSSGSGVLEARFVEHMLLPGRRAVGSHYQREVTFHYREWIDASREMRREQRALPAIISRPRHVVDELASSPGWIETWSSTGLNEIHRISYHAIRVPLAIPRLAPGNLAAPAPAGIATFRRLYLERGLEFIGRERWHGRLLWKLESDVAFVRRSAHAKLVPIMALVVLVDPHTYLPVVQRQLELGLRDHLELGLPGHRYARTIQTESDLVGYRRLPGSATSEALLKLSAQHPRAHVVTTNRLATRGGAGRRGERNTVEAFLIESARALVGAL